MSHGGPEGTSLRILRPAGTLRTQVVSTLRNAIIDGTFKAGERLVERKVCDLLGVSRTLVREALRQLEAEGLVENAPYRGPSVTVLMPEQVQQIYEMRGALEGLAAKLFVERADDSAVAALVAAVETIADCYQRGDGAGQRQAVEHFYDLLLRGTRNDMLCNAVASHRARLAWLRAISLSRRARGQPCLDEKRSIVRAIAARDAQQARALAEAHVANALAGVLDLLNSGAVPSADERDVPERAAS